MRYYSHRVARLREQLARHGIEHLAAVDIAPPPEGGLSLRPVPIEHADQATELVLFARRARRDVGALVGGVERVADRPRPPAERATLHHRGVSEQCSMRTGDMARSEDSQRGPAPEDEIWAVIIFLYQQSGFSPRRWEVAEGGGHD